jgi:hypothetical protein
MKGRCVSLASARTDLTISDLRNELAALGINVGRSSVGRLLLQRLQLTFKKPCAPPNSNGLTSSPPAPSGGRSRSGAIRGG